MKGKAHDDPVPYVAFGNYRSTMPDWPTARECAMASQMLATLIEVRALLFLLDQHGVIKDRDLEMLHTQVLKAVMYVVDVATGMIEPMETPKGKQISEALAEKLSGLTKEQAMTPNSILDDLIFKPMPPPPGFPKPPGFK